MTIGPKVGPLEKNFFETCFYEFKMIVLMKDNVFDGFKDFEAELNIFKMGRKKF